MSAESAEDTRPFIQVQVGPTPSHQKLEIAQKLLKQAEEADIIQMLTTAERALFRNAVQNGIRPTDALAEIAARRYDRTVEESLEQVAPKTPPISAQTKEVARSIVEVTVEVFPSK